MNLHIFNKNGLYLPFISFLIYLFSDDIYLSTFFFLKSFSINYYIQYSNLYPIPTIYKWKHMVRLTDIGHIASFLFYFNKKTLPIAHNVHFIIDVAYWLSKIVFNMKDSQKINPPDLSIISHDIYEILNHSISYILITYYMISHPYEYNIFNDTTLYYTFIWLYSWILFIYIPWILLTNNYLYSVFEPSKPLYMRFFMIVCLNILAYLSNIIGHKIELYLN